MRLLTTTAITAAALAMAPAAAHAENGFDTKTVSYEATLTGSQVTTWEYDDPDDPNDPCDHAARGNGDQTIRFTGPKKFRISFIQPNKSAPDLFGSDGRPVVVTRPVRLSVDLTAERNGEITYKNEFPRECADGDNGGGVDPGSIPLKDCGTRTGKADVKFFFHSGTDDDLFVPIPGRAGNSEKDQLKFDASGESYGAKGGSLDGTFMNCPFQLENVFAEKQGLLYTTANKVSEKKLLSTRKGRSLVVSGSTIATDIGAKPSTGKTIIAWNLRMKRVK
jgi:hypothetical protein